MEAKMKSLTAKLQNILDPSKSTARERYEAFIDGGGGVVTKQQVAQENVSAHYAQGGLELTATNHGIPQEEPWTDLTDFPRKTYAEATPPVLEFPQSWQGYDSLWASVTNGDKPLTFELTVVGARGRMTDSQELHPGQTADFIIDLTGLPLVQGKMPEFEPVGIRLVMYWKGEDIPHSVTINKMVLNPSAGSSITPCVDRWGQRKNSSWPGKVRSDEDMRHQLTEERKLLNSLPEPKDRTKYGGWANGPRFEASGFFRVTQADDGRWWYVDPEGYAYLSMGPTGVREGDSTRSLGREFLFEELPDPNGPEGFCYDTDGNIRLYYLNVLRKYGSMESWRDHVCLRFRKWGVSAIANWSSHIMFAQEQVPYVRTLGTRRLEDTWVTKGFNDVFDHRWEQSFDEDCRETGEANRDNPWILGYFIDNESRWRKFRVFDAKPDAAIRDEWMKIVRENYETVQAFNDACGFSLADWDAVKSVSEEDMPREGAALVLREKLEDAYAERYFSKVREIFKRHNPNHLYLGNRFTRVPPRANIVRTAGEYVDVLSVNCYTHKPDRAAFDEWYAMAQKPIQIGEHQLSKHGPRQYPPLWPSFTGEERRKYYPIFDRALFSMPYGIGSHWFQHADQHITGRPSNGENMAIGWVDITDRPQPDMVDAVREICANMYVWHADSK